MAPGRVTGVLWWEMELSHYKAIFRRARHGEPEDGYTKDLLQATRPIERALSEMLEGDPPYEPLTYRWPGGSFPGGKIFRGADRLRVGQWTAEGAPAPWRIGDPGEYPLVTLEGDPDASIPDGANEQWERLQEQKPLLVMVQLEGAPTELHLRAYLGAPPPHLRHADLDRIPVKLREELHGRGGLAGNDLPSLWFDPDELRDPWRSDPASSAAEPTVAASPSNGTLGSEYRPANESVSSAAPEPFEVDPDERDRGTQAHAATQNELAALAAARGHAPRSPRPGEPNYDIAWEEEGALVVVEVKSVTARNSEKQLRLALGQVLRYRDLLEANGRMVRGAIALSAAPHDERWSGLCTAHGVGLIWRPELEPMLAAWLSSA